MTEPYPQGQWDTGTATPPPKPKNGMGVAALVFGILALLLIWLPVAGLILGLLAIIFGVIGRGRVRKQQATNGGVALTGLILGVLTFLLNLLLTIAVLLFGFAFFGLGGGASVDQATQCVQVANQQPTLAAKQSALQQCVDQFGSQMPDLGGGQ
ncbi:DUF4190 domain-containing protein [Actinomycetospora sp. NBRC 106378]|uniref:DUF4190 domain-containing protein n=1 Tax=Actinomycetospora sp. NBRC 106378 TaxID=3032208 RepID=UPI0024A55B9A|nr:DUF4190 domain-containing protein [Actinomycetospora sp. NBRC 106378]GLZ54107.1 hypothetical protein Acsp07_37240 [Actinomycetospora sp. NBRC 106378]